jgi:proteasome lid subunit RPN8/RPN11
MTGVSGEVDLSLDAHGLRIAAPVWAAGVADAEARYPREACGLGFGPPGALTELVPVPNVQDRLHAGDPAAHPRTARDAFALDAQDVLRALAEAEARGLGLRVIYHAHCDAGPHLSDLDAATAALWPGVVQVILSVIDGVFQAAAAYRPRPEGGFEAVRLWPPGPAG